MNGLALCAGVGGLELGIGLAIPGYRAVGYVEREAYAASSLVARMGDKVLDDAPVWDDLATFDGRPWRGVVDLVSAGFPCQPFSAAGKQRGTEDERWLWPLVERVIREVQPRWVVLENVPGLVLHGLGPVLSGLASLGYDAEWDLFSAESVGAPHKRERFFLLARRVPDPVCYPVRVESGRGEGATQAPDRRDAEPGNVVEELADADGGRQPWLGLAQRAGLESERRGEPDRHGADGRVAGKDMADAGRQLREGGHELGAEEGRQGGEGWAVGRRLFPPGPSELEVWAGVLAEAPTLEPALCRVAHELPDRVDRLRACGNGVVPLAAAYAVVALADRAGWLDEILEMTEHTP